ncbi:MAG: O-antigen ligase family protein, partial [Acidimicrobiia bacterium]
LVMLMGMPFWWLAGQRKKGSLVWPLLTLGGLLTMFVVIVKTGSRGGAVAMLGLVLIMLVNSTFARKIKLIAGAVVALMVVLTFLPGRLERRYKTMLGGQDVDMSREEVQAAVASRESRIYTFKQSVRFTVQSPLFGIGPGMFQVAARDDSTARGDKPHWVETHNMYTQVSSEAGIPAFVFFMATLLYCLKTSYTIYKTAQRHAELEELALTAYALLLSSFTFAVSGIFSNVAYALYLPTLAGIQVTFVRSAEETLKRYGLYTRDAALVRPPSRPALKRPAFKPAVSSRRVRTGASDL